MPITINPLFESNVTNSIKEFLNLNVVTPYNTQAASSLYTNTLGIRLEKPVDPTVIPKLPLLVIFRPVSNRSYSSTGLGDGTGWIYKSYRVGCFPSLDPTGTKPDPVPEFWLRSLMDLVIETALYIPMYDYSSGRVLVESAQVSDARLVMPIGKLDQVEDIERFRFDAVFTLEIPVVAING